MSTTLQSALSDRADDAGLQRPDPSDLVRRGRARVRRRRSAAAAGVGGLAAALAVGTVWLGGGGDDGRRAVDPATVGADLPLGSVTWTQGSVLHSPDGTLDLGHVVIAYVATASGFVTVDPGGIVRSVTADGVVAVGRTPSELPRLVSDQDGTLAGWVDDRGDRPAFVVLDQADGALVTDDSGTAPGMGLLADEADPAYLYALDGGQAYWRDQRGLVEFDVATGEAAVLDPGVRNGFDVSAVEDGLVAGLDGDRDVVYRAGSDPADGVALQGSGAGVSAVLSTDGRFVSLDGDEPQVFDTATGALIDLGLEPGFAAGYQWLDDTTLAVLRQAPSDRRSPPVQLLTCEVVAPRCEVVAQLPAFDDLVGEPGAFNLPNGSSTSD